MHDEFVTAFLQTIDHSATRMLTLSDAHASDPSSPGKWSGKEIVGHLIDSAANNQARFVRAQLQDDLIFAGYDQDAWVRVQGYRDRPWLELVHVWRVYNQQIGAIMRATPQPELDRPRLRHNLDKIGFQPLPDGTPATLAFLMHDYVAHLEHHLRQVFRYCRDSRP